MITLLYNKELRNSMKSIFTLSFALIALFANAQDSIYYATVDLNRAIDDQLRIKLKTPSISESSIEYHMPKIVPGTYSISDFGRFVTEFTAISKGGDTLEVNRLDINRWEISQANQLDYITYLVDDTFDKNERYQENIIFEPGGTNIEVERNVFMLNTFGLVGYLKGYKFIPYQIEIQHSPELYGASALKRLIAEKNKDVFTAENYNFLADGPIMYCEPDTAIKTISGAEIIISVYSPNKRLTAAEIMATLNDLIEAQTNYLGGKLPVDRYAYLIYLMDRNSLSGGMGALEHSYSSMYTLPDASIDRIGQFVRDVAAHEFLHIVTPLNIHSEQIHEFNYIEPEMSKHLWLYEGVTEYSAMHVQIRNQLISEEDFLDGILGKVVMASKYPEVAFTEMSEKILKDDFAPMYGNVYEKGALIGMCLDLYLIRYSDGKLDLPGLLAQLAKKYGPHQAFEDDGLIDEITAMTYPEVGEFFKKYVEGSSPLPLQEVLSSAGYYYKADIEIQKPTLGNIAFEVNEDAEILISDVSDMNAFGKKMGYQAGDIIKSINGMDINLENIQQVLDTFNTNTKKGDKITVVVQRKVKDADKQLTLKAKAAIVNAKQAPSITSMDNLTEDQQMIRKVWLKGIN